MCSHPSRYVQPATVAPQPPGPDATLGLPHGETLPVRRSPLDPPCLPWRHLASIGDMVRRARLHVSGTMMRELACAPGLTSREGEHRPMP
jgi:hypothetical protein